MAAVGEAAEQIQRFFEPFAAQGLAGFEGVDLALQLVQAGFDDGVFLAQQFGGGIGCAWIRLCATRRGSSVTPVAVQ